MTNPSQPGSHAEPREPSASTRLWTVRIKGVPLDWDEDALQEFMRRDEIGFPDLKVRSLAIEVLETSRTATGTTRRSPTDPAFSGGSGLRFELDSQRSPRRYLTVDVNFLGLTSLFTPKPEDHKVDVVAISGIGSHAFGSFQERGGEYMWLRDDLPFDLTDESNHERPIAATVLYGYDSRIHQSNSFQVLDDLGKGLRDALRQVAAGAANRRIIIIGHSLGGLVIKQALMAIASSDATLDERLKTAIYGFAFFGTPHEGMEIKSLLLMAQEGPNRSLVEMLDRGNSHILTTLKEGFPKALRGLGAVEVVCYYETLRSPTAQQDAHGKWSMNGQPEVIVTQASATSSGWLHGSEYNGPIARTHSELVKFAPNDHDYANVRTRLREMCRQSLRKLPKRVAKRRLIETDAETHSVFEYNRNEKGFFGREEQIQQLLERIHPSSFPHDCQRTAVFGLGGMGKTRLTIETLHRLQQSDENLRVFWVTTTDRAAFEASYRKIGKVLGAKGLDSGADITGIVKTALEDQKVPWLLVVDNADDRGLVLHGQGTGDERQKGLKHHLPHNVKGSILFTTRERQLAIDLCGTQDKHAILELKKLPQEDAFRLFVYNLEEEQASETESITALLRLLDYLPLAIRQASAHLSGDPSITVSEYLAWCQESEDDLVDLLSADFEDEHRHEKSGNAVAKTWLISLKRIETTSPLAVGALRSIAYLAEKNIPISLLFDDEMTTRTRKEALRVLASHAIISQRPGSEVVDVHRLVRIVTRNWVRQSEIQRRIEDILQYLEQSGKDLNDTTLISSFRMALDKSPPSNDYDTITRGVNLDQIKKKAAGSKYSTMADFMKDIHLYFGNAQTFHKNDSCLQPMPLEMQAPAGKIAQRAVERDHIETVMRRFNKVVPGWDALLAGGLSGDDRILMAPFLPHAEMLCKAGVEWHDGDVEPLIFVLDWTMLAYRSAFWRSQDAVRIAERMQLLYTERELQVPIWVVQRLALAYRNAAQWDKAEPLFRQYWEERSKLDKDDQKRWIAANILARFLIQRTDLSQDEEKASVKEARDLLTSTFEAAPTFSSVQERGKQKTLLESKRLLAIAHKRVGSFEVSENLLLEALKHSEDLFGRNDKMVLSIRRELAGLYRLRGDNEKSQTAWTELVGIMEQQTGADNDSYLHVSRAQLAIVRYDQGEQDDALPLMRQSVSSLRRLCGNHTTVKWFALRLEKMERGELL